MPNLFERLSEKEAAKVWYEEEAVQGLELGYCFAVVAVRGHEQCTSACERGAHVVWRRHHPSLGPWPAWWAVTEQWRQQLAIETGREVRTVSYCQRPAQLDLLGGLQI